MKETALVIINELLLQTGISQTEVDHLLARFLEEEALDYVEAMKSIEAIEEIACLYDA